MPHLKDLKVEFVSLVDRAAVRDPSAPSEPQKFLLWKAESGQPTPTGGSMTPEEMAAKLEKAQADLAAATERAEKAEKKLAKKAAKADPEQIDKSELPQAVREALEKAETERDTLRKAAEDAEKIAKEERDLRVTREFVAKAETEFSHVAGDTDAFGKLLKSASEKLSKDEYDALLERFRSTEALATSSDLFKSIGQGGDPAPTSGGSVELRKLEDRVAELRKDDSGLSHSDAMARALRENPEAAASYLASVR